MAPHKNKFSRFWQELKRRRVIHVITVYASAAFVIIELVGNLAEPLNLPTSLSTIVIIVLAVGFPPAIILSWLYDLTSGTFERTEPMEDIQEEKKAKVPNAYKIATYVSFVVIAGLVVFNIVTRGDVLKPGMIQSLAILPFDNYTGDEQLDYVAAGLHYSLIGDISKLGGLRVIGKTSSSIYQNTNKSAPDIARELNVEALVEPAVICYGDSVCLQIRVITMYPEEKLLYVEEYKVDKSQVLNLYSKISKQIADELFIELSPEEERLLAKSRTVDREAFDAYLRSQEYWGDFSPERFNNTRDYLNSAIEKDPDWAPLYIALAQYWMWAIQWNYELPAVALPKAYENLNKALELDPDLPDAHYLNGWIAFVSEWDWAKAESEFLKALAINPNDANSRIFYAHLLCVLQRQDEASPQAQFALDLDPLNPVVQILFSAAQLFINECEADLTQIEKLLADDPNNFGANYMHNNTAIYCGDYETAIVTEKLILQTFFREEFDEDVGKEIEKIFEEKGYFAAYEKVVAIWEDLFNPNLMSPMELAIIYTKANQYDKIMDLIEKAYEIRDHTMPYIVTKAYNFEPLYDNPRFIAIVEKMNLSLPNN